MIAEASQVLRFGKFDGALAKSHAPMTDVPEPSISLAAVRMRRHRKRRRDGLRCLTIQLRETEIEALIYKGLLKSETRHSKIAIINALHAHFDHTLSIRP